MQETAVRRCGICGLENVRRNAYTIEMEIKLHTIIINIYCDTKNEEEEEEVTWKNNTQQNPNIVRSENLLPNERRRRSKKMKKNTKYNKCSSGRAHARQRSRRPNHFL